MAGITLSSKEITYADGYPNKYTAGVGYAAPPQIENWIGILKGHIKEGRTDGIYSMSGSTRKLLGAPC
jgi:hypothetical protein